MLSSRVEGAWGWEKLVLGLFLWADSARTQNRAPTPQLVRCREDLAQAGRGALRTSSPPAVVCSASSLEELGSQACLSP